LYILGLAITGILTGGDGGLVVVMEDMDMVVVIGVEAVIEAPVIEVAVIEVAVIEVEAVVEEEVVEVVEAAVIEVEAEAAVTEDNNLLSPLMPLYVILIP
jgi:hypothetical protein